MNILLGKVGQKIIFDRRSEKALRSNSNGNYGTYMLIKLLVESNPQDTFFIASENDLHEMTGWSSKYSGVIDYPNLVDISRIGFEQLLAECVSIDATIVFAGLVERQRDNGRLANIVNYFGRKYILLADDPRCLDSIASDCEQFTRIPDKILSGFVGWCKYNSDVLGTDVHVEYAPLEKAVCYRRYLLCEKGTVQKSRDFVVVANSSGDGAYNRARVLQRMLSGIENVQIYGNFSDEERHIVGVRKCAGVVDYGEMQHILGETFSTMVVPIKQGWVTSKYMEALMNGVFPIFHKDYGMYIIKEELQQQPKLIHNLAIVESKEELWSYMCWVNNYKSKAARVVERFTDVMVKPYQDGKLVNEALMSKVRDV